MEQYCAHALCDTPSNQCSLGLPLLCKESWALLARPSVKHMCCSMSFELHLKMCPKNLNCRLVTVCESVGMLQIASMSVFLTVGAVGSMTCE